MKKYQPRSISLLKYLSFFSFFICLPFLAHASAIAQFKSFLVNTHSARGSFAQVQVKQEKGEKLRMGSPSMGVFLFSKPGKFIWHYQKPYEQILHADGKTLYIYDKDLSQVTTKKLDTALGASPAAILFGSTDIEKNFTLSEDGQRDDLKWMKATPKDKESTFRYIKIGLKNQVPVAMELYDLLGQISLIKLTQFEKNPKLNAKVFQFEIPKGVDVFKN